jgi:hypothetical protein
VRHLLLVGEHLQLGDFAWPVAGGRCDGGMLYMCCYPSCNRGGLTALARARPLRRPAWRQVDGGDHGHMMADDFLLERSHWRASHASAIGAHKMHMLARPSSAAPPALRNRYKHVDSHATAPAVVPQPARHHKIPHSRHITCSNRADGASGQLLATGNCMAATETKKGSAARPCTCRGLVGHAHACVTRTPSAHMEQCGSALWQWCGCSTSNWVHCIDSPFIGMPVCSTGTL